MWGNEDAAAVTAAREWLAGRCGPYRALWVATATTPTGVSATGALDFPEVAVRKVQEPTRARLLPDRWMVRLYDAQQQLAHTDVGERVPEGLAMAPALAAIDPAAVDPVTGQPRDALDAFLAGQGLDWMMNVRKAVEVGMAVRIPIADVPNPVGALVVLGARSERDPLAEAAELDDVLSRHWYTRGFDVVPQGTPTNNTDAGRSAVSVAAPDIDELFERETSERPLAPGGRAVLMAADPALMYRVPAADALSLALGRVRANTFDRTSHAETVDGLAAWAMNLAIGYATLGDYLDGPLAMLDGRTATGAHTLALRDWFIDWVRGAGPLPAIRCGAQPYGVLPTTSAPQLMPDAVEFRDQLEHHLVRLTATWQHSLPTSALDPDATDARPSVAPAADAVVVGEVLGAVPHPTSFQLRVATDNTAMDQTMLLRVTGQIDFDITREPIAVGSPAADLYLTWQRAKPTIDGIPNNLVPDAAIPDIHTQLANAEAFRDAMADAVGDVVFGQEALAHVDDDLLPLLEMHRDATERVPPQLADFNESGGVGSNDVIRLVHTTFEPVAEPVTRLVTTAGDLSELDELLGLLIAALDEIVEQQLDVWSRQRLVTGPAPLLHHLLDQNRLQVSIADAPRVKLALQAMRAGLNSTALADPEGVLERLLRESLGLGIHRIDAWITSLASERLAAKRHERPAGIQIGGYGWLLDLAPSDDPVSQGFIHAPSLSHAATAAVLRSGWHAFGTDSGEAPLSIDLSSDRVRGGTWILDGVRNGQDLAETLGARFERYLHDRHLDDWIQKVRQHVLDVTGAGGPPTAVVDGLLVARAASEVEQTPPEELLHTRLWAATAPTGNQAKDREHAGVRAALRAVAADLDSVSDLTMAQSVHTLLRGNTDAASGALAVTGGGDAAVPPITVTASQRDAQLVSHRVVAAWPVDGPATDEVSVLELAEPRLTAWLQSLLPPPDGASARVVVRDAEGQVVERGEITLADVGLTAMEAAHLAGGQATQTSSRLGRILAVAAADRAVDGGTVAIDLGAAGSSGLCVDEFGLLAGAVVDAAGRGRPLRPADLVVPGAAADQSAEDLAELDDRLLAVEERLDQVAADLASRDTAVVRAGLLRCAAIDIPGAVAAIEAGASGETVAAVVDARSPTVGRRSRRRRPGSACAGW